MTMPIIKILNTVCENIISYTMQLAVFKYETEIILCRDPNGASW